MVVFLARLGMTLGIGCEMEHLMTVIVTWLALNFGLPAHYNHPSIEFIPEKTIHMVRYGGGDSGEGSRVVAIYDDAKIKILLTPNWSAESASDISILVHEMVHHLQRHAGLEYECAGAREKLAYAAQAKWLKHFGTDLRREFKLDEFTLKVITACPVP
jgi:Domain of unknown function (DUF6647)